MPLSNPFSSRRRPHCFLLWTHFVRMLCSPLSWGLFLSALGLYLHWNGTVWSRHRPEQTILLTTTKTMSTTHDSTSTATSSFSLPSVLFQPWYPEDVPQDDDEDEDDEHSKETESDDSMENNDGDEEEDESEALQDDHSSKYEDDDDSSAVLHPLLRQTLEERQQRAFRFPSIDERVRLYMGPWYAPPCSNDERVSYRPETASSTWVQERSANGTKTMFNISSTVTMARLIQLDRNVLQHNLDNEYAVDVMEYLFPSLDRVLMTDASNASAAAKNIPILAQFGDSDTPKATTTATTTNPIRGFPAVPYLMKFRFRYQDDEAISKLTEPSCDNDITGVVYPTVDLPRAAHGVHYPQPVIWRLTSHRHFGMMMQTAAVDISWDEKKNAAVWRGALTGIYRDGFQWSMVHTQTPRELCQRVHRCRLACQTADSDIVNAKLVGTPQWIPAEIEGVAVYGDKLSYEELLQYKAIIMLEGNDISSGFKWALYSNSVVLTQPPTKTSWAMEELLEPWVHYVPLNENLTDVEDKTQWVLQHPDRAQEIAHRGSLWIQDLLYHPDAPSDDQAIYDEMLRRYLQHFVLDPTLASEGDDDTVDVE